MKGVGWSALLGVIGYCLTSGAPPLPYCPIRRAAKRPIFAVAEAYPQDLGNYPWLVVYYQPESLDS